MLNTNIYKINILNLNENLFFSKILAEFLSTHSDIHFIENKEAGKPLSPSFDKEFLNFDNIKTPKNDKYYYFHQGENEIGINLSHNIIQKDGEKNVYRVYTKE
ncbi:MAG: hypothetical protein HYX60_05195 [Legionella longbeachae]|nr:hypothetical protein [Legionella longbeachae]